VSLGRYSILVVGVVLATLAVAWPLFLARVEAGARLAIALGVAVAVLNTVAAYALVRWSAGRATVVFFRAVLGGMLGRMALMLAALAAGVLALGLPALPLASSLLAYFLVFLVLELSIVHHQSGRAAAASR
jgi:hypothetical protein